MSSNYQIAARAAIALCAVGLLLGAETVLSWTVAGLIADFSAIVLVGTPFLLRARRLTGAGDSIRVTTAYLEQLRWNPWDMTLGAPAAAVSMSGLELGSRELVLRADSTLQEQQTQVQEWVAAIRLELIGITEDLHDRLQSALYVGNDEIAFFVACGTFLAFEGMVLQAIGSR